MRPLIEHGRVFAAVPPLHRVIVLNPGSTPNDLHLSTPGDLLATQLSDMPIEILIEGVPGALAPHSAS